MSLSRRSWRQTLEPLPRPVPSVVKFRLCVRLVALVCMITACGLATFRPRPQLSANTNIGGGFGGFRWTNKNPHHHKGWVEGPPEPFAAGRSPPWKSSRKKRGGEEVGNTTAAAGLKEVKAVAPTEEEIWWEYDDEGQRVEIDTRAWYERIRDWIQDWIPKIDLPKLDEIDMESLLWIGSTTALVISSCGVLCWFRSILHENGICEACVHAIVRCGPCVGCTMCMLTSVQQLAHALWLSLCCFSYCCGPGGQSCSPCECEASPKAYGLTRKSEPLASRENSVVEIRGRSSGCDDLDLKPEGGKVICLQRVY